MVHGVINIRKEKGFTSHDVVAKLRGILGQKKIGHTGTLDPDATGVLPVCLGKATKLCDMLTDKDKTYETVLLLGKATDTQDISGTVLSEKAMDGIDNDAVERCIGEFVGEYLQVPPKTFHFRACGWKSPAPKEPISVHCAMISERNSAVVAAWRNSPAQK